MSSARQPTPWDGRAHQLTPGLMIVGPEDAALIAAAIDRVSRIDGVRLSPRVAHVRRIARHVAAQRTSGRGDVPEAAPAAHSEAWISTEAASATLNVTARHVRRLVMDGALGESRLVRGRLLVLRDEVAALAAERKQA